ncbi:hypothetical protein GCM10022223_04640 [Kineosporia mesophila]|uniref:Uncharacterized protein n=1 Tax=Kineosporia mesophila TaxID=566012 RepID=A0ABP6Z0A1_9ACTN
MLTGPFAVRWTAIWVPVAVATRLQPRSSWSKAVFGTIRLASVDTWVAGVVAVEVDGDDEHAVRRAMAIRSGAPRRTRGPAR